MTATELNKAFVEQAEELAALKAKLSEAFALLNQSNDCEMTHLPFWYIATNAGATSGRRVIRSNGVWFSREAAEDHLRRASDRYPKSAYVYCDSAHETQHSGLGRMITILRDIEVMIEERPSGIESK